MMEDAMIAETGPSTRWVASERDLSAEKRLQDSLGIAPLLASVLVARGLSEPDDADAFLNPKLEDLHDPMLLPDAEAAVREIMAAKERGDLVYVHGDYDADGVSSAAIWTRALRRLGFQVAPHVPHRMKEGYGIHASAVDDAISQGAKVLLTCDCGSSAFAAIEKAREAGMRVVVTDHHELSGTMPEAHALVNPHRKDSTYPFQELCGAAVAFKIAQAVSEECGVPRIAFQRAFLDLVCLGTIADIVPLVGENRILASHGLEALSATKKLGLQALIKVSDIKEKVRCSDVGFRLAPRINAAGRVDDADHALSLLLTDDPTEAMSKAALLDQHNRERQSAEERIFAQAEEMILEEKLNERAIIIVAAPGWHVGVVGIVASRITERFYRPALVGAIHEEAGYVRGSARSIETFQLYDAMKANEDLFASFGGHAMAAGFSLEMERFDEAIERLTDFAAKTLTPEDLIRVVRADAEVVPTDLGFQTVSELQRLEPFGAANPTPKFLIRNTTIQGVRPTRNEDHIMFRIQGANVLKGIAFRSRHLFEEIADGDVVDMIVEAAIEKYNGQFQTKLQLKDIRKPA